MKHQGGSRQFEIVISRECHRNHRYLCDKERFQVCVRDVAGRDEQEFVGPVEQQEGIDEIGVFGYHHPLVTEG